MAMNNTQIHTTLPNANVRDTLSDMIARNWNAMPTEMIEAQIKKLQEDLARRKAYDAAVTLIEKMGWKEFDLIDETSKDGEVWMSFIGTKEEYEQVKALAESQLTRF